MLQVGASEKEREVIISVIKTLVLLLNLYTLSVILCYSQTLFRRNVYNGFITYFSILEAVCVRVPAKNIREFTKFKLYFHVKSAILVATLAVTMRICLRIICLSLLICNNAFSVVIYLYLYYFYHAVEYLMCICICPTSLCCILHFLFIFLLYWLRNWLM